MKTLALALTFFTFSSTAFAFMTELGLQYARKKTTFDQNNYIESESTTGSLSIYFLERIALELSYTQALGNREEKASSVDPRRTSITRTTATGADLVLVLADKKALFQPYIKGGAARITRLQEVDIEGFGKQTLEPEDATVPSYGAGIKIPISEALNLKLSYDVWQTPVGNGVKSDDASFRAGMSWYL